MTVRELINKLLRYEADETIEFVDSNNNLIEPIEFGLYSDLPFIKFETNEED